MRAAVLRRLGEPPQVESLDLPKLQHGQVLVEMQLAGVCQSQRLEVSGGRGPDSYLPHLIGHEGVGLVADFGPGVTKVQVGDQVVLSWIRGAGQSAKGVTYSSSLGTVNAGPIATFCETPIVSEQCVSRIEPAVEPENAVLAGCALPTGAGTVWNAMPAKPDGSVCIFGMGGVGLAAVAGAVWAGWGQIVAVDLVAQRLERARSMGCTETIDATVEDVEATAQRISGQEGFDLVVECAGSQKAMETAIRVARPGGGRVVIAGNLEAGRTINVDPFDLIRGRWIGGSWGGGVDPDVDIPRLVRLVAEGEIDRGPLIGSRFRLDDVNAALMALSTGDPGRPLIEF
jgi:S-(hydroxymethyl)glutathione dehydrogenase/alcohol dehydrogenase